jgi:nucleotide-binding universal stress UspA family protein
VQRTDERGLVAPTESTLVRGDADRALLDAAKGADLLVGSRGLGSSAGALGSVSHGVIAGAPCPVVVVPSDGRSRGMSRALVTDLYELNMAAS